MIDIKALRMIIIPVSLIVLTACGGGSSNGAKQNQNGDGDNTGTPPGTGGGEHAIQLTWDRPNRREDGSSLRSEDIQSFIIITIGESQWQQLPPLRGGSLMLSTFLSNGAQFNQVMSREDVRDLFTAGSPHATQVSTPAQYTLTFEGLEPDTYYFAISAVDLNDQYSDISGTIRIEVAD